MYLHLVHLRLMQYPCEWSKIETKFPISADEVYSVIGVVHDITYIYSLLLM